MTRHRTSLINRIAALAVVAVVLALWAVLEIRHRTAEIPLPGRAIDPWEVRIYYPPDPSEETQCTPPVVVPDLTALRSR